MKCKEIRSFFYDYADGTVDDGMRSAIKSHLSGCASCRRLYEKERRLHRSVAAAIAGELADLHFKAAPVKAELSGRYTRPRINSWGRPMAIAASCLIVFCATILMRWKFVYRSADAPALSSYAEACHYLDIYRTGDSGASDFATPLAVIIQPGAPVRVIELDATTDISTVVK